MCACMYGIIIDIIGIMPLQAYLLLTCLDVHFVKKNFMVKLDFRSSLVAECTLQEYALDIPE